MFTIGDWYGVSLGYVLKGEELLTPISLDLPDDILDPDILTSAPTGPGVDEAPPTTVFQLISSCTEEEDEEDIMQLNVQNVGFSPVQLQLIQQAVSIF